MDLVGKLMSLLFNTLSRFITAFLSRSKHLLISWLQSQSAVILEPKKIKSVIVSIVSPSICHEVMGPNAMILVFWMLKELAHLIWRRRVPRPAVNKLEARRADDVVPSPKYKGRRCLMKTATRTERINPPWVSLSALLRPSVNCLWCPTMRRAICFIQSTDSNVNLIQKHPSQTSLG